MKMPTRSMLLGSVLLAAPAFASENPGADSQAVEATLNRFHQAASRADGVAYFALFAPEGIFIGTDAAERWTVDQFRAYAMPYFSKGRGWTYVPRARHVQLSPRGDVAWFDEILDSRSYGVCRGSGVLRREGASWLICQYHLTIPVPNDLAARVVKMIGDTPVPPPVSPAASGR